MVVNLNPPMGKMFIFKLFPISLFCSAVLSTATPHKSVERRFSVVYPLYTKNAIYKKLIDLQYLLYSLQTILRVQRSDVPLWVIIISSIIGLILVGIIGFILYKVYMNLIILLLYIFYYIYLFTLKYN